MERFECAKGAWRLVRRIRGGLSVIKNFLVERGESGCSHRYDLNFISQISKGKKQFVHLGGVIGGDFDYWVAGGVGFARD